MSTKRNKRRLHSDFFERDVLQVAPDILGCLLIRKIDGEENTYKVTEVEAYRGEEDKACHARAGKTNRTRVMYEKGGLLYVYLIYGIHWMLNIVTGPEDFPQALLIRSLDKISGPGRLTKALHINGSFNGMDMDTSDELYMERSETEQKNIITTPRVGVDYAGEYYSNLPWRFVLKP